MILYRAVNDDDINTLQNYDYMYSSLFNSYIKSIDNNKEIRKNVYIYTKLCAFMERKYALDTIIGHISGKRISAKISPWVSVSPDFNLVSSEYSIPQSGRYNFSKNRKNIAIIDIPDNKIISDEDNLLCIRESMVKDFVVDLRSDNLSKFYKNDAIMAEKYNENMPGYDVVASYIYKLTNNKTRVNGFSNFATSVSEMLVYGGIKKEYIKALLSPKVVDIIYSCNINDNDFIIKYNNELNVILNNLNLNYIGRNLVDILYDNYNNIKGSNIEEKYSYLMYLKKLEIKKIVEYINKKYNKNFEVSRLLDDKVVVKSYNDLNNLQPKLKNDLILIEKDNLVYYHDFSKKGFYNSEINEVITSKKVYTKIKDNLKKAI